VTNDAVAKLNRLLKKRSVHFEHQGRTGYLKSVLKALHVPIDSQVLVFSKTALNPRLVGPKNPRAIFFNDEIYVGWVPGSATLEISAVDPQKGVNFYTLSQSAGAALRFTREESCLACHAGSTTLSVPGHVVRSFLVRDDGKPVVGYSRVTHDTDYAKRWGGWYVTGTHGKLTHMGNVVGEKANERFRNDKTLGGNVTDLKRYFDVKRYPSPHSDIVAQMVLAHQAHGHNLITRVNFETRLGRVSDAEERLLRYFLFIDEPPLIAPVRGTSSFARTFSRRGPADSRGRSLRQFDLKTRLFKFRLSFLIHSAAFNGLPVAVRLRFYRRLWKVLTGIVPDTDFRKIPASERKVILQILRETRKDLPAYWRESK